MQDSNMSVISSKEFVASLKMLDAGRLQKTARAIVQGNGRLSLTVEAGRIMGLDTSKSLVLYASEDSGDLGATVSHKGDTKGFELKKVGTYHYISFKNYLREMAIDYKSQRIVYDITKLAENIDGRPLFRFARRILAKKPDAPHSAKDGSGAKNQPKSPSGMAKSK